MRSVLAGIYAQSVRKELSTMRSAEYLADEEIRRLQDARLSRLLKHASTNVPYYRRVLAESGVVSPDKAVHMENWGQIPFLTKDILHKHLDQLLANDPRHRKYYFSTSGGSTGEPARFAQDAEHKRWARAAKLLYDEWTGYRPGMPKVVIWVSEQGLVYGRDRAIVRLNRWLKNIVFHNAFLATDEDMQRTVDAINRHKPVQILAYVVSLYELARFIERESLEVYSPASLMSTAGTLYPEKREVIERVFRAPVYNRYGSREVGDIACECEAHSGLHTSPLAHYLEIVRDDGTPVMPGEIGELVVTSLVNYTMPLVRYRIGDMAAWGEQKCSCGRSWPMLKEVVGRLSDVFTTSTGARVLGGCLIILLHSDDWIRRFQCIQEEYDYVRLLIVPSIDMRSAQRRVEQRRPDLEQRLRLVMGSQCRLGIELMEEIPPSASGKHRYVMSKVTDQT